MDSFQQKLIEWKCLFKIANPVESMRVIFLKKIFIFKWHQPAFYYLQQILDKS